MLTESSKTNVQNLIIDIEKKIRKSNEVKQNIKNKQKRFLK